MKILKKIDIYIIKKFLGTYFFAIALILAITVMFDINEKLDSFLKAPLSATIFDYFSIFFPILPICLVLCLLLSLLYFLPPSWPTTPRL